MDTYMNKWMNRCMDRWISGYMHEWTNTEILDRWMDNRWINRYGWIDEDAHMHG